MRKTILLGALAAGLWLLPAWASAQRFEMSGREQRNMLYFEAFKSGRDILFNWAVNSNVEVTTFIITQGVENDEGQIEWQELAKVDKNNAERNTEYYYLHKRADLGQMIYRIREEHMPANETLAPIFKSKFY